MISGEDLAKFLDEYFAVRLYTGEQAGIYRASPRPVRRIGLALEASPELARRVAAKRLDWLFLHRPWKLDEANIASDVGVVAYHLAFDERLTLGYNARLADVLKITNVEVLGRKEGRPLGMVGDMRACSFDEFRETLRGMFGGEDAAHEPANAETKIARVCFVGAMNDALVREAHERGAQVYVTGQMRHPAKAAVAETGLSVVCVGHRRSEEWGLRALAGVLRERFAELEVVLAVIRDTNANSYG
jgi:putative NIF3 family GTP cyclohydrolase 1 type 2